MGIKLGTELGEVKTAREIGYAWKNKSIKMEWCRCEDCGMLHWQNHSALKKLRVIKCRVCWGRAFSKNPDQLQAFPRQ